MENVCFYSPTGNYLLNHTEEVWITEVMETVGYFFKKNDVRNQTMSKWHGVIFQ